MTGEMRIRVDLAGHSAQQPLPLVVEHVTDLEGYRQDELRHPMRTGSARR
ncbi:hypothetical protein LWC35_10510 [Pseudonocardia kujensis]|nr:hypothetical protein [Pseudonocardia kujensis]MCE0763334.1 hypothetical protein [Pseudonocardia kujensis]